MSSSSPEPSVAITRTAQVGLNEVTIPSLTKAATTVGAPSEATLYTAGMLQREDGEYYQQSVIFTWVEKT